MSTKENMAVPYFEIGDMIAKKRDGKEEMTTEEMNFWVKGVLAGGSSSIMSRKLEGMSEIPPVSSAQLGAWLMAVVINGLSAKETADLTKAMLNNGQIFDWPSDWKPSLVDKHSIGGVGDKVSLVLAPALAACGRRVPMISGRGLGLTGGTLDKLESIPGFNVSMSYEKIKEALDKVGFCIAGQTEDIAPADKIIYHCRDHTETVGNLSLQTSSIICKKAAENISSLVLDIKFGKGCYQPTYKDAEKVADSLIRVSRQLGITTTAVITEMDNPLGRAVGNSLEVRESIQCLKGKGPPDLEELVATEGGLLLLTSQGKDNVESAQTLEHGKEMIRNSIKSGLALEKFKRMMEFQGVSNDIVNKLCSSSDEDYLEKCVLPTSQFTTQIKSEREGIIKLIDASLIARVSNELGAGRLGNRTEIDHSVGVLLELVAGDQVRKGEVWATVHHSLPHLPLRLKEMMDSAILIDNVESRKESSIEQKTPVLKIGEKFCVKKQKSKVVRILMKDDEV